MARDEAIPDLPPELAFLAGGRGATRLILDRDWSEHPLGPPAQWPGALKVALSLILNSPESMILSWGREDLWFFFNETYFPLLGPRLGWAMGERFDKVWADAWDQAKPIIDDAFAGRSQRFDDLPWKLDTDRGVADTWWSFSYSRVLDEAGAIAGLFIFTNETTKRVLTDRDLVASRAALEELNATLEKRVEERTAERDRLWNNSPDLLVVMEPDGRYRAVNPAWTEMLGYAPGELIGVEADYLAHPDDLTATQQALVSAQGGVLPIFEHRVRHKDGSYRWVQWVAVAGDNHLFAIGRNITAMREAQERLGAAEDQLRQAQKMESVGQLTGGIAHDFNNMLTGVIGSLDMLGRRLEEGADDRNRRYVDMARVSADRAAALTQRLLAFSRRQSLDVRPVDVNALVRSLDELLRRTIGEHIQLALSLDPKAWPALTDVNQLESALINLVINARDAMRNGGTLIIATANRPGGGEAEVADFVSLCVADTGEGMSAEIAQRAFDPFFTTKAIGAGTGLGLSMIHGFANQTGGQVSIDSSPGAGTRVDLLLPRSQEVPVEVGHAEPADLTSVPGAKVLLVEDEATVRLLIAEVLEELGYDVRQAADAQEAMREARAMERIDLLVSDVGLPGVDGRELADAVRGIKPGTKVLFVTAYAEQALRRDEFLAEGMAMVTKPFDVTALSRKIREMIES